MPSNTMVYQASAETAGRSDTMYRDPIANGRTKRLARKIASAAFDRERTSPSGEQRHQGARGVPAVGHRVLLVRGHLREGPLLALRHEERVGGVDARKPGEGLDEHPAVVDDEVVELLSEHVERVADDLLKRVRLQLRGIPVQTS